MARMEDIAAYIKCTVGSMFATAIDSGDTGTKDALNGANIDLLDNKKFHSLKVAVPYYLFFNTSGIIFKSNILLQDRSATTGAGSTWANFGTTGQSFTVTNGTSTAGTFRGVAEFDFGSSIRAIRRHMRTVLDGDSTKGWFNSTATGHISNLGSVVIFGGAQSLPATSTSAAA